MIGFHHLRARVLTTKGLEPFPARDIWKRLLDYLMYCVGIFAPLALLPQILQIYTTKSSTGLSLSTWLLFVVFNVLWATYGAAHKDKHIFFANILMAFFNSVIVIGVLLY
ncbi:MAG: SemiSWEET family transporter [Patescibacteria group bacterium]